MYDYGDCHVCRGHVHEKRIKLEFWIKGKLVVVEDVPVGVCVTCGEKTVRAPVEADRSPLGQLEASAEGKDDDRPGHQVRIASGLTGSHPAVSFSPGRSPL